MKRLIIFSFIFLAVIPLCSVVTYAQEYDEAYFEESIFSAVDADTRRALDALGIENLDYETVFSVSISEISDYFSEDMISSIESTVKDFFTLFAMLLINSIAVTVFRIDKKEKAASAVSSAIIIIITVSRLKPLINMLLSTMKLNGDFMLAFVPIFTLLVALSGSPGGAVTYNTLVLFFSEGISAFINNFATSALGCYFGVSISFSMNSLMNINRMLNAVNKVSTFIIGFLSSAFAAMLSVKGVLSVSVDSASAKGIKFLLSSLIPIVGSSISDAYSSLLGSISLIKGSVAAIGILVVIIISFPAVFEGVLYCISFSLLSYISDIMDLTEISGVFRVFYTGIRLLLLLSIFESFIMIISIGIMLNMKGGI